MKNDFFISIIIPVYNRADSILRCLDSVWRQTYQHYEVIVVDDGSVDNTLLLLKKITEKRFSVICHSCNKGPAEARNTGIKRARGDFIAFLDSDDEWFVDKLKLQVEVLKKSDNPEKTVVYCKLQEVGYKGNIAYLPERGIKSGEDVAEYLFINNGVMQTSGLLVPAEMAKNFLFRTGSMIHNDYEFVMNLEQAGAVFKFVDQPLYIWNNKKISGRVSKKNDPAPSLAFIKSIKDQISQEAYGNFMVIEVLPKLVLSRKRFAAVKLLIISVVRKRIAFKKAFIYWLPRVLFPGRWLKQMYRDNES